MADQLLEQVRDLAEGQIDFEGQRLAELAATALLATAGVSIIIPNGPPLCLIACT